MEKAAWPRSVAILYEGKEGGPGELSQAFAAGFRRHVPRVALRDRASEPDPGDDLVLGYGPSTWQGSLLPYGERLAALPREQRPFFYWWFIESLPNPGLPLPLLRLGLLLRMSAHRLTTRNRAIAGFLSAAGLHRPLRRGFRFQVVGELQEFRRRGLLDGLAITSGSRAALLRRLGFDPIVVPIGYDPVLHGRDLGMERDIDVGFLGSVDTRRRREVLGRIISELAQMGISVSVQTNLYGEERTEFLNRTRIVLNIFRSPADYYGLRFLFCAGNKALLVSEAAADSQPFVPGTHLVTAPIEQLSETIARYARDAEARREIVGRAHSMVNESYTMGAMAARIIEHARALRGARLRGSLRHPIRS